MKIAVFYNLDFGGAKRAVFEQTKRLKERGHTVDVYTTDKNSDYFDLKSVSNSFCYFKFNLLERKIPFLGRFIDDIKTFYLLNELHKKIALEIDNKKYDICLVHPDKITQAPFVLRHLRTKNVYYCQEPLRIVYEYNFRAKKDTTLKYLYEQITRSIRKKVDLKNARSATFTLASCCYVRERMIEAYGVYPRVSYLGIDQNSFKPIDVKKKNQVFFVGNREVMNDGFDLLKTAVNLIPKKVRPTIKMVSWIKENSQRLSDNDLAKEYSQSLAVICPNRLETFGLVPLESMATGTPVIATKISGHRETIVDGQTGFLTDFDPLEISERILGLLKSSKLAQDLGKEGRKHILENWTWDKRIVELEKSLFDFIEK